MLLVSFLSIFVLALSSRSVGAGELSFIVMGDWGGLNFFPYKTPVESAVAKQMSKIAEEQATKFVVALGDNFYFHGVKNVDDKRFEETFENVFSFKSLMVPWYFCAGNHDHYGNASAEIAYSQKSSRWNFPDYYYSKDWDLPGTDKKLQLVMIDTILLCGNTVHDGIEGNTAQGPDSTEDAEEQWSWLENTLKSSQAHYLLVGGHFPVWSIAEHGPTECLVERLKPLLEKYKVTAYLSGHDHNLQVWITELFSLILLARRMRNSDLHHLEPEGKKMMERLTMQALANPGAVDLTPPHLAPGQNIGNSCVARRNTFNSFRPVLM